MTLVKFKQQPEQNFNKLVDSFFTGFPSLYRDDFGINGFKNIVPVNVKETESGYQLDVIAPGFNKEDFEIQLDKNLLTISVAKKEEKEEKHIRREYKFQSLKRSFTVDEQIDTENIAAGYVNGILSLNLPKKAEVKAATKNITIQ